MSAFFVELKTAAIRENGENLEDDNYLASTGPLVAKFGQWLNPNVA